METDQGTRQEGHEKHQAVVPASEDPGAASGTMMGLGRHDNASGDGAG